MLVANFMRFWRKSFEKHSYIFFEKKSKTNLFDFFVPFDVLLHY